MVEVVVPRAWAREASAGARWAWIKFRGSRRVDDGLDDEEESWLEGEGEAEFGDLAFVEGLLPMLKVEGIFGRRGRRGSRGMCGSRGTIGAGGRVIKRYSSYASFIVAFGMIGLGVGSGLGFGLGRNEESNQW
jgi:hypothetical protein